MTDIKVVEKFVKKTSKIKGEYFSIIHVATCSKCGGQIYAPQYGVSYKYCYNCGEQFVEEVDNEYILKKKRTTI